MHALVGPVWMAILAFGGCALGAAVGTALAEEAPVFNSEELNLRLSAPVEWKKLTLTQPGVHFAIQRGSDMLMLLGGECNDTLESIYEQMRAEWKSDESHHEIRTVVFVQGPWAAQVWIETLRSNIEATRPD